MTYKSAISGSGGISIKFHTGFVYQYFKRLREYYNIKTMEVKKKELNMYFVISIPYDNLKMEVC